MLVLVALRHVAMQELANEFRDAHVTFRGLDPRPTRGLVIDRDGETSYEFTVPRAS